jgi:hypothetical protein
MKELKIDKGMGGFSSRMDKLYDRRGYNPEKSASCFATYSGELKRHG